MAIIDVFNGDADGICALQQLRLQEPCASTLVSGIKREIDLLRRVEAAAGDLVTVLDLSLDKNRADLQRLLEQGVEIRYFDHHYAGDIPNHPGLVTLIDTAPEICTSLLVDQTLEGRFRAWAVVGAFGDNLDNSARQAARDLDLDARQLDRLRELGIYLNYNGYGATLEDLHFPPDELFR
ncbi:MAG TPA: acetyltransferase, partial [Gammaproteobacteria bacterium]|nr:acetyltransferase [Gammaproteobacteria bacterium]